MLVSLRLMIIPFCELNSMMRNYLIEMSHKQRNKKILQFCDGIIMMILIPLNQRSYLCSRLAKSLFKPTDMLIILFYLYVSITF